MQLSKIVDNFWDHSLVDISLYLTNIPQCALRKAHILQPPHTSLGVIPTKPRLLLDHYSFGPLRPNATRFQPWETLSNSYSPPYHHGVPQTRRLVPHICRVSIKEGAFQNELHLILFTQCEMSTNANVSHYKMTYNAICFSCGSP